jgi:hypothetical protein
VAVTRRDEVSTTDAVPSPWFTTQSPCGVTARPTGCVPTATVAIGFPVVGASAVTVVPP